MKDDALRFESFGTSHPGRVRELNEDRYLIDEQAGVWMVADGMGGHDAGEVASSAIVEQVSKLGAPRDSSDLIASFQGKIADANDQLQRISAERTNATIGSTVVAILAFGSQYTCLWSGDSRAYLLRNGELRQLSKDHTEVQELVDRGVMSTQEARTYPRRNVITRAIGVASKVELDRVGGKIQPGDVFVVCSDGLMAHVEDEEILELVSGCTPQTGANLLLDLTLSRGATDNVTIIIAKAQNAFGTAQNNHELD